MTDLTSKAAEIRAGLKAAIDLGDRTGARGKRPENIYNLADEALALIEQQAAELAAVEKVQRYLRMAEVEDPWRAMIEECEAAEDRATAAEAERAEHLATIARLEGERDEARRAVAAEEARHGRVVQGFVEVCDAVGVRFDAPEAVAYEINVKIGNAEHRLATAESTIATQAERIAALEAALKASRAEFLDILSWHAEESIPLRKLELDSIRLRTAAIDKALRRARALTEGGAEHG